MTAAVVEAPLDLRDLVRRWRFTAALVILALGVAVALAAVENAPPQRPLDPRDASPVGARALAELLRQRSIPVTASRTIADVAGATVFVPDPQSLAGSELARLADTATNLVVVGAGARELTALGVDARPLTSVDEHTVSPRCPLAAAKTAGPIRFGGITYVAESSLTSCYPADGGRGLLSESAPGRLVTVVGSAGMWTNARLGDQGDAALALGLLSTQPRVVWLLPRPPTQSPADREYKGLLSLLPARLLWALLQLLVGVLLFAWWRGRRMGPVVAEPLPVIVPAAETVRGRARLLRAARARDAAAAELRTATIRRISDVLGLGPDAPGAAVVAAVSGRTGRTSAEVESLLYGADPHDDAALVSLCASLDGLESTVKGRR